MLTYREISEILKMVDASECDEFVLELEGVKLAIRRGGSGGVSHSTASNTLSTGQALSQGTSSLSENQPSAVTSINTSSSGGSTGSAVKTLDGNSMELRSPMVGTFYRRPSPDKPFFVEEGDSVNPGTPLCLIEVMKLYTTIESTVTGTVHSILAEDGSMIEYDQLLFLFDLGSS